MPADANPDRHASDRAALERTWIVGRSLAEPWRGLRGTLPITPEELVEPEEAATDPLDVYPLRIGQMRFEVCGMAISA